MEKIVLVPVADGTEELEAMATIDILRRSGAQAMVASASGNLRIAASRGVVIVADTLIVDGKCVTGRSAGTAVECAFELVEQLFDKNRWDEVGAALAI